MSLEGNKLNRTLQSGPLVFVHGSVKYFFDLKNGGHIDRNLHQVYMTMYKKIGEQMGQYRRNVITLKIRRRVVGFVIFEE